MITDSRGTQVRLGPSLGYGGEGEVFDLPGTGLAAKVQYPLHRTQEWRAKLRIMVAHPPADPTAAMQHPTLCWPRELLYESSEVAGFLMPRVDVSAWLQVYKLIFPPLYPGVGFHWGQQLQVASNLAAGLAAVHDKGYVIGDLNFRNLYATPNCLVTFIDCDSIQVVDPATGRIFRCPVGMSDYMGPELQNKLLAAVDRTDSSDSFAFAVMVCQLLLTGTHPFNGGRGPTREENILRNDCLLLSGKVPLGAPTPQLLPPAVLGLLVRCFRDGYGSPRARPTMREFDRALSNCRGQVATCLRFPNQHVYSSHLASCPWCDQLRLGIDSYRVGMQRRSGTPPATARRHAVPAPLPAWRAQPPPPPPRLSPTAHPHLPSTLRIIQVLGIMAVVLLMYLAFAGKPPSSGTPPAVTPPSVTPAAADPPASSSEPATATGSQVSISHAPTAPVPAVSSEPQVPVPEPATDPQPKRPAPERDATPPGQGGTRPPDSSAGRTSARRGSDRRVTADRGGEIRRVEPPAAEAPVIAAFEAVPMPAAQCTPVILRWTVHGASSLTIEPGFGIKGASDYVVVQLAQSARFVLEAQGPGGVARQEVTVLILGGAMQTCHR
jgi:serine/threonine protein kinase